MTVLRLLPARAVAIAALLAFALFMTPAHAQKKKSPSKKGAATPALASAPARSPLPPVTVDSLSNGLRLLFCRVNDLPLVEVNLIVNAGVLREPEGKEGLAQLMGKLIFSGTPARSRMKIVGDLSTLGSTLTSSTGYENTQLYLRCLSRNFRQSVDILADVASNARFTEADVRATVRDMAASMAASRVNAGERATQTMLANLFGAGHPLTRSLSGGATALDSLTVPVIREYYDTHYRPGNATLVIVGDVNVPAMKTVLEDRFAQWKPTAASRAALPARSPRVVPVSVIDLPEQRYTSLRLGVRTLPRNDADVPVLLLLNQILGGTQESRLHRKMWSEHLLMPGFFSTAGFSSEGGYLVITGNAPAARIDSTLLWLDEALDALGAGPITDAELARAKRELTVDFEFEFATNRDMHARLREAVQYGLDPNAFASFPARIASVRGEDVARLARTLFARDRRTLVLAGASARFLPDLKKRFGADIPVQSSGTDGDPR
ncbi:MAG: insulinase family protein [Ignavibacteria bacterium]|nr:insulinase family protein [Ignavibacteria bacterium]